jgi:hypothetical protein
LAIEASVSISASASVSASSASLTINGCCAPHGAARVG